jgi:hypothetical protein
MAITPLQGSPTYLRLPGASLRSAPGYYIARRWRLGANLILILARMRYRPRY